MTKSVWSFKTFNEDEYINELANARYYIIQRNAGVFLVSSEASDK